MLIAVLLAASLPAYWVYQRFVATESAEQTDSAQQRSDFLTVADDYAATLFAEQKWEEAAKAYRLVRERYLKANGGAYDEAAGALLFNEAASELNRGDSRAARALLLELAREVPSYRPEEIAELIRETGERSGMQDYEQLETAASVAFDRGDWNESIRRYGQVLEQLRATGYSASDDIYSQTQYDQAMAYWNGEGHAQAEELLRGIRSANPDYDPERIDEQHRELLAILREQPGGP
ncbi:MAG: hypothetical protein V3V67_07355 [Myxococcota bacterium]